MLHTRALYNLLRLNVANDPSVKAERWALEDYRVEEIGDLFSRLNQFGLSLDKRLFLHFANQCDTPEDLTDLLLPDEAPANARDPFYLIVFELWRRLVPEKSSLSIFCDELDYQISQYDLGHLESDEKVQDALANLMEVLDENADSGADPEEIFRAISEYCAHDLESFLYDYIADLLDSGNSLYASELIEGFSPYMADPLWFDFLRVRLISFTDIKDANTAMRRFLETELELQLLLDMLHFLSANAEHDLFKIAARKAIPLLTSQEELVEVMSLITDFYQRLDEDEKERLAQKILNQRKKGPIHSSDLQKLQELIAD